MRDKGQSTTNELAAEEGEARLEQMRALDDTSYTFSPI